MDIHNEAVVTSLLKEHRPAEAQLVDRLEASRTTYLCLECLPEKLRLQIVRVRNQQRVVGAVRATDAAAATAVAAGTVRRRAIRERQARELRAAQHAAARAAATPSWMVQSYETIRNCEPAVSLAAWWADVCRPDNNDAVPAAAAFVGLWVCANPACRATKTSERRGPGGRYCSRRKCRILAALASPKTRGPLELEETPRHDEHEHHETPREMRIAALQRQLSDWAGATAFSLGRQRVNITTVLT